MYKTVVEFYDLTDGDRKYRVGDEFPRPGFSVSKERLAVLLSSDNNLGKPVIEKIGSEKVFTDLVEPTEEPKPRGRKRKE